MSNLTLRGNVAGTGTFIVESPNSNISRTLTLPDATTTLVGTDATQTLTNKTIQGGALTLGTIQASTSGTNIDFNGIPSWVKRVTVLLSSTSTSGTQVPFFQLGTSAGLVTSSYEGRTPFIQGASVGTTALTTGIPLASLAATAIRSGFVSFTHVGNNIWIASGTVIAHGNLADFVNGIVTLPGQLDRIRFAAGSSDTFDAGSVNIMYEG